MRREEVYDAWAPDDGDWSGWVKPVLFAGMDEEVELAEPLPPASWLTADRLGAAIAANDAACVVDLPGAEGIAAGLALAAAGFRPIPLYCAVDHAAALIDMRPIVEALIDATSNVVGLSPGARPAFLLDARRMSASSVGVRHFFDNRSVCRPTDFPSAQWLRESGISKVLLITSKLERPAPDLEAVAAAWQGDGLALWRLAHEATAVAEPYTLQRRAWPIRLCQALARSSLHPRRDGSYGALLSRSG